MTEELLKKIENGFYGASIRGALLGNSSILFSEDEYSEMVEAVGDMCERLIYYRKSGFDEVNYEQIFVTLVEIAKRWKTTEINNERDDNGFWPYVSKTIMGNDNDWQKLRIAFTSLISDLENQKLNYQHLPIVKDGKKYYATVMMHAFAPISSLYSFFDLCFNVFKKDLDYGFTSEDEWIGETVAMQLRDLLKWGYKEDKGVSIGSSVFRINIGLRSYILHPDMEDNFERFVIATFYKINSLYNLENVEENSWVNVNIVKWWRAAKEVNEKHIVSRSNRMPAVASDKIVVSYVRNVDEVNLCIPPIRLKEETERVEISIFVEQKLVYSREIETKRGELVITTKQVELNLDDLLKGASAIDLRVVIKRNGGVIFDSESQRKTSLNREFILFAEEKEIFNQVLVPSNYFVYSLNVDGLRTPEECQTFGYRLYNIYPKVGEVLAGIYKRVDFIEKVKSKSLGKKVCLLGNIPYDTEWKQGDISCQVYSEGVQMTIPKDYNIKALELRVNEQPLKLECLYDEDSYYRIDITNCIPKSCVATLSLYSFERKDIIFKETIVLFDDFRMSFNKPYYYGEMERKLTIEYGETRSEISWGQQEDVLCCPIGDGELWVSPPTLRWRINSNQWQSAPIVGLYWYKDCIKDGDLLHIDYPISGQMINVYGKYGRIRSNVSFDNSSQKFKIGRFVYSNEDKEEIVVSISDRINTELVLFKLSTKEFFKDNPFSYREGRVLWNVEETFVGEKNRKFFVEVGDLKKEVDCHNQVLFDDLKEDVYDTIVRVNSKNIFTKEKSVIYRGFLIVGKEEKFQFRNKMLKLLYVSSSFSVETQKWEPLNYTYIVKDLNYFELEEDNGLHCYYLGNLFIEKGGKIQDIDELNLCNEKGEVDLLNPVRIELRSNNSLWLIAGYNVEDKDDFLGELIFDRAKGCLCNFNTRNNPFNRYKIVNLYKFKEEEYVQSSKSSR